MRNKIGNNRQSRTLIVSMYSTEKLKHVLEKSQGSNRSATLIVEDTNQSFFGDYKTGIVWNPENIEIMHGFKQDAFFKPSESNNIHTKRELKLKSKNPEKLVYPVRNQAYTDYTRWDVDSKISHPNRTNEEGLGFFTNKILKRNKQLKQENQPITHNELVILPQDPKKSISGLILDISDNNTKFDTNSLKDVFKENPNFNLYIFNKGQISAVRNNNVQSFIKDLESGVEMKELVQKSTVSLQKLDFINAR